MAANQLLQSELLQEQRVTFPGDGTNSALNWLGNAPFLQVQAIRHSPQHPNELRKPDKVRADAGEPAVLHNHSAVNKLSAPSPKDIDQQPEAFALHLKLSNQTFVSRMHEALFHLKVEVFFNGQLSNCVLITFHDVRTGVKNLHQVFAGVRTYVLAERPWVILPPGKAADGNKRQDANVLLTAEQRWQQINQAIQHEGYERIAASHGKASPSANFLQALAIMEMPSDVRNMQPPGGRLFGAIDVVISAGAGKKVKNIAPYLSAPQRLPEEKFIVLPLARISKRPPTFDAGHKSYPRQLAGKGEMVDSSAGENHPKRQAVESRVFQRQPLSLPSTAPSNMLYQIGQAQSNGIAPNMNIQGLQHSLPFQGISAQIPKIQDSPYLFSQSDQDHQTLSNAQSQMMKEVASDLNHPRHRGQPPNTAESQA